MQWQEELAQRMATEQALCAELIKSGKCHSGRDFFLQRVAENFGESANPAERQFSRFYENHPNLRQELFNLLGITPRPFAELNAQERELVARLVRLGKVINEYFVIPTTMDMYRYPEKYSRRISDESHH